MWIVSSSVKTSSVFVQPSTMLSLSALIVSAIMAVQGNTECEWGKYGEHCNQTCPQNCGLVPPRNLQFCTRDTGKCTEGCQRGWHGDLCETDCNINCPDKTCNQQTGHCTFDCNGINVGVFCNVTRGCGRGWYGDMCQHPCSINCLEERCHHTTGACMLGCSGTYTGEFCNTTKVVNNKEDGYSLDVVVNRVSRRIAVAFTVAGAVTFPVTFTAILFLRWRRRRNRERGQTKSSLSPEAESSEVESPMITDGDSHMEEPSIYSGDYIEGVEEVLRKMINNYSKVKNTLKTHGRVTMSGAPGGGKTAIALMLGREYRDEGYEVVSVNDILKFNLQHYVNQGKDMCFIFPDVFKTVELPKDTTLLQRLLLELKSNLKKRHSENVQQLYAIFTLNSYSDTGQIPQLGEVGDHFFSGPPFINFNVGYHLKI